MLRKEKIAKLKEEMKKRLEEKVRRNKQNKAKYTPPRYDKVYYEGVKWLEENG
ncbi:hypothetical protein LCGC14_2117940 [marine sediment metagenome]|uniref:Uncharacterized protein n=1 Tax=marine sediment metagenome TaxID=412755 RepID=A0A0F9ES64_9ZZZZ